MDQNSIVDVKRNASGTTVMVECFCPAVIDMNLGNGLSRVDDNVTFLRRASDTKCV